MNLLECSERFFYFKYIDNLSDVQMQTEDHPLINKGAKVPTHLYIDFSDAQGQQTQSFKLIHAFIVILVILQES